LSNPRSGSIYDLKMIRTPGQSGVRLRRGVSLLGLFISLLALAGAGQPGPDAPPVGAAASRQADDVAIIVIDGVIDSVTATSMRRRVALAEASGADAIVLELNTPGGDVSAVLQISDAIKTSSIGNTVAWVHHEAISGGAFLGVACGDLVAADPAKLGNALPILTALGIFHVPMSESDRQKMLAQLLVDLVDSARRHGYDEKLVQGFVTLGVELWLVERVDDPSQKLFIDRNEYELIFGERPQPGTPDIPSFEIGERGTDMAPSERSENDYEFKAIPKADPDDPKRFQPASPDLEQFVDQVTHVLNLEKREPSQRPRLTREDQGKWREVAYVSDGKSPVVLTHDLLVKYGIADATIQNEEELKSFFAAQRMTRLHENWSERMVRVLNNPWLRGVLVAVFLLGLFLEMTSPGVSVPGAIAAVALLGLLAPAMMIGMAGWWELAAIGLGIGLILLEVFVTPGFGLFGVAGLAMLFAGLVGTFVGGPGDAFEQPGQSTAQALRGLVIVLLAVTTSGVGMYFISRRIGSLPFLNALILKDAEPEESRDDMLAAMALPVQPALKIGDEGVVTAPLRPIGRIEIGGELIDARADMGYIDAGQRVRIVALADMGRVLVAPVEDAGGRA
jgi:membrane-bound serine protease (ClpP class)